MPSKRPPAAVLALFAIVAAAPPAEAQLRSVVVPAEGIVVVPPRSAPRLTARPAGASTATRPPPRAPGPVMLPDTGLGLAGPVAGLVLPAIAGALLGSTLAGSRGGTSGPVRTR